MDIVQALILGLVQGATEFLPISSSGHLVLVPWLLDWKEPGLVFDTTMHLGTLVAILAFLRRDLAELSLAWLNSVRERGIKGDPRRRIAWLIVVGTVPAVLMGFFLEDSFEALFGSPCHVATLLLITGLMLAASEWLGRHQREMGEITLLDSLLIGAAQACAIAPGISRSGATMAMGLFLGLKREAAARYSFLLATPIILSAGLLQLFRLVEANPPISSLPPLAIGFLAALVSGYLGIKYLLIYLRRGRLYIFAIYCWVAGLAAISLMAFAR